MIRRPWVAPSVALTALALTACGGGGGGSGSDTTLSGLPTTVFTTLPPVTTAPSTTAPAGGGGEVTQPTTANGDYEYTVQAGDYWFAIAQKFPPCTFEELVAYNDGKESIFPGDKLAVPQTCDAGPVTPGAATGGGETDPPVTDPITESTVAPAQGGVYEVVAGDYWLLIAQKVDCSVEELKAFNGGKENLFPGDKIALPAACARGA
jgi:LysM repeat protein